jgi:acyl carrier protein
MNDARERLVNCFAAVFPRLSKEEIQHATPDMVRDWDSVSNIMLISVIEEEFNTSIAIEDIENLRSFELALYFLENKRVAAG